MRFVLALLLLGSAASAGAASLSTAASKREAWTAALRSTLASLDAGRYEGALVDGVSLSGLLSSLKSPGVRPKELAPLAAQLGGPVESFLAESPERREALLAKAAAGIAAGIRAKTDAALYQVENDGYDLYEVTSLHALLGDLVKAYLPYLGEDARRRVLLGKKKLAVEVAAQKERDLLARARELAREVADGTLVDVPSGDWPGGSEPAELTEARLEGLRARFAGGLRTQALAAPFWFDALVAGEPAAINKALDAVRAKPVWLEGLLVMMGGALARIVESDRPGPERLAVLRALRGRFVGFLTAAAADGALPLRARRQARHARTRLLDESFLIPTLLLSRRARDEAKELRALLGAKKTPESSGESWRTKPRIPAPRPGKKEAPAEGSQSSVGGLTRTIATARFRLEKLIAREALVRGSPRFSASLRRRALTELKHYRARLAAALDDVERLLLRLEQITLGTALHRSKTRTVVHVSRHPGLRLVPEPGGFLLAARFKTDIQDPKVLAYAKASIEEYWRGRFELGGTKHRFRTAVEIVPLAPGESFPEDALQLRDGGRDVAGAHAWGMALDRGDLDFSVPAHEFGHVLGLGDEYLEFYDVAAAVGTYMLFKGSLMGDREGAVLPRHLRLVYQLLRRHRLAES